MKTHLEGTEKAETEHGRRIVKLEAERRTLLQAHLAGAVPVELLREQQNRITRELAQAGGELANSEVDWLTVQKRVSAAVMLVSQLFDFYSDAEPTLRRRINQAAGRGLMSTSTGLRGLG